MMEKYNVTVTVNQIPSEFLDSMPTNIGLQLYACTVFCEDRSMETKIVNDFQPTPEEALEIIVYEARIGELYQTPEAFGKVFDSLQEEPDILQRTFEEFRLLAEQLKSVLGQALYDFYIIEPGLDTIYH